MKRLASTVLAIGLLAGLSTPATAQGRSSSVLASDLVLQEHRPGFA